MSGHLKGKCSTSTYRGWLYNLRACQYSSDEDSEDEGSAVTKTSLKAVETLPDDVQLLRDLDISSRHDDAVFKPNPWTIAKVNAASRQKKPLSGPTSQPSKPSISRPEPSRHGKPIKTSGKQQSLSLTLTKVDPPHECVPSSFVC
ncbi:hypothetical protein B0H21DRAFT_417109 [Amylocystis lapponica]|nr:hypothetical protein B0H21DRAFT_417109 [Amylocystis lapponica]